MEIPDRQPTRMHKRFLCRRDRKSTRLNSSHVTTSRMPPSAWKTKVGAAGAGVGWHDRPQLPLERLSQDLPSQGAPGRADPRAGAVSADFFYSYTAHTEI